MSPDENLAALLPRSAVWAADQEHRVLRDGFPLDNHALKLAREAGVKLPDRVRILLVPEIPFPEDEALRLAAKAIGLTAGAEGLTLGYGISIRVERRNAEKLIAHELVHVAHMKDAVACRISCQPTSPNASRSATPRLRWKEKRSSSLRSASTTSNKHSLQPAFRPA